MLEPPRRTAYRTWPGAFAVLLAVGLYVGGLMLWDSRTPGRADLARGQTVEVGPVRFIPADDWRMDVSKSRAGRSLVLFKGGHRFLVNVGEWAGGPDGPMLRQRRLMERGQGLRIDGDLSRFFNSWGLGGTTFAYYGPQLAGRFWQLVEPRRRLLVQLDLSGSTEGFESALDDARAMVDSMDLDAPR